ncbi:hypothetical protein BAUCODRAFT_144109 [Baudoinia panamericana UAMH 10762]|uniref:Uncharacterized protein n=1 Tax=Baudoinia panamericana (strain UAMH 10762) TaxID=717646 RepID=M2NLR8_BAUPA|nr:uncharacterized protein BAUCODRAFT_144109 [Baudoinia panamericana UAMH 10762]EMD00440.1 hypothetical protein BAUCODRAFT_144109 [Baudoinia panamericana UAMH 10762]
MPSNSALLPTVPTAKTNELVYLEWFMNKTTIKLPGIYKWPFWRTLVLQAGSSEPAVLHALLALSSAHRAESQHERLRNAVDEAFNAEEQFSLSRYCRAITELQPHLAAGDKASVRVALITCAIFTCIEFLQGRYQTGLEHLRSGLKLLCTVNLYSLSSASDTVDEWLLETFARLSLQVALFDPSFERIPEIFQNLWTDRASFESVPQARRNLDCLLQASLGPRNTISVNAAESHDNFRGIRPQSREQLEAELASWHVAYSTFHGNLRSEHDPQEFFASLMLQPYHAMAVISAGTHLDSGYSDEMAYDRYLPQFVSMIRQSISLLRAVKPIRHYTDHLEVCHFSIDIGWIPQLYFTALKCRNNRVRLHALKLLSLHRSREGVWDTLLASAVAREVIQLEEGDFYHYWSASDGFSIMDDPGQSDSDSKMPVLPPSRRVQQVQVVLPNGPSDTMRLTCMRPTRDGGLELLKREHDPRSGQWMSLERKGTSESTLSVCSIPSVASA